MEIGYQCLDNSLHAFKGMNMDGIRCPICQSIVMPTGFSEQQFQELPEYKVLVRQNKDSKREKDIKRLESIKSSGIYTTSNREGPGNFVSSVLKEDFDWLVEQLEKRMKIDI